jgi:hypothetical protein
VKINVYPSGFAFTAAAVAICPPAPGMSLTTTGCPRDGGIILVKTLAFRSWDPPALKGIIMVIGFLGYFAARVVPALTKTKQNPTKRNRKIVFLFISLPPLKSKVRLS